MHNVYNLGEIFYLWDIDKQEISLIGNEKDLIVFLAKNFRRNYWSNQSISNTYFNDIAFCKKDSYEHNARWQFFDGFDRIIDIRIYKDRAFALYEKELKIKGSRRKSYWIKNYKYKGFFRKDPVEGIHKRKGSCVKPRRIKAAIATYFNPEHKDFNRGSKKNYPDWYDDFFRHIERSWKRQSKRRHQWKEK